MPQTEYITRTSTAPDSWLCACGNTPAADGFYPCDREGQQVEPTAEAWTTDCYVCARCGRIIHQERLEVVGRAAAQSSPRESTR